MSEERCRAHRIALAATIFAVAVLAGCGGGAGSAIGVPAAQTTHPARAACSGSRIGHVQCLVMIENGGVYPTYVGWSAKDLEAAYNMPITKGKGQSVWVVDAYDNPNVASDFAAYRYGMGLPEGKLNKYNQDGEMKNYPQGSPNWGVEIDLDVQMASASCPKCTIDLIEANSNQTNNIQAAEKEAVKLGATIVSNSYEGSGLYKSAFNAKGVTYIASSGDAGYGGSFEPVVFPRVIAVGGTFLNFSSGSRGYSEVVWADSGGGCSDAPKPKWQHDPDCSYRTLNDISAVAVGVAEYDRYSENGWIDVDGTSIPAPLIAGMYGLAGNSTKQDGGKMLWKLSKRQQSKYINYISTGSNGNCGGSYLCTAGTMQFGIYSGPGGWGSPNGVGAL